LGGIGTISITHSENDTEKDYQSRLLREFTVDYFFQILENISMNYTRIVGLCIIVVGVMTFSARTVFATGFNLNAKGAKSMTVSNKVGSNQIQFFSKAPLEDITGTASVNGTFTIDASNIEATTGKIVVPVSSMQTGNEMRDGHLRGKDWLEADANPNITFEVKKITGVSVTSSGGGKGVAKGVAEGTFSVHGVSKPMSAPIELTYIEKPTGDIVMIKTDFKVALKEYNVQGKKGIVGSKVGEVIDVKASLFAGAGA
jgi:polyisoprenoid-binding protein YceI